MIPEEDNVDDVFCPHCKEIASHDGNLWFEVDKGEEQ